LLAGEAPKSARFYPWRACPKVGCSISTLRKIGSDERHPSKQLAELIANAHEMRMEERATFLRIARGGLAIDRLTAPPHLLLLRSLAHFDLLPELEQREILEVRALPVIQFESLSGVGITGR